MVQSHFQLTFCQNYIVGNYCTQIATNVLQCPLCATFFREICVLPRVRNMHYSETVKNERKWVKDDLKK